MLSRFAFIRNTGATKCLIPVFQPMATVHTSAPVNEKDISRMEYPPPTSKRDFVNYPRPVIRNERPPVRFALIPGSWFEFFYPKTGYTGPYMFIITVGSYLFSKEKIVCDHNFMHALAFILAMAILNKKLGPFFKKSLTEFQEASAKNLDEMQMAEKQSRIAGIKSLEGNEMLKKAVGEATNAKKEMVLLQLEHAYRERVAETYKTIKKRLDCLAELENADRRNTHKNLIDYVLRNVQKSLTPELEKNVMQNCISELNSLAAKA